MINQKLGAVSLSNALMKGMAEPEGLFHLPGCGGAVQQQLPHAHGTCKAWAQTPRCPAGPNLQEGYDL